MSQLKKEKIPHAIRSKTSTCHHKNLAQLNKYFFKKLSGNMEITGDLTRAVLVRGKKRKSKQSRLGRKGEAIKWKQWVHITLNNFGINRTKSSSQRLNWSKGRVCLFVDWCNLTMFICWRKWYPKEGETECRSKDSWKAKCLTWQKWLILDLGSKRT